MKTEVNRGESENILTGATLIGETTRANAISSEAHEHWTPIDWIIKTQFDSFDSSTTNNSKSMLLSEQNWIIKI